MKFIPYGRQSVNEADIRAVVEVLESDWITQGPAIQRFENRVAEYCNAKYAAALSSGTAALHTACLAAGLKKGDWLWTTPNTFAASANCGLYCGAKVDFVDIDPATYNMSIPVLKEKLKAAESKGRLPKALVMVHFAGQSCEMDQLPELASRYGITVIEDACHALGGSYLDKRIGSCTFSDMSVFSFHPVKIITTGEGGMITTNNVDHFNSIKRLRSHGITRDENEMVGEPDGEWYYEQVELGFNYRITDIQAALGYSQMDRIDEFVKRRNFLAERYSRLLRDLPLTLPSINPDAYSAFHLYVIRLKLDRLKNTKRGIFRELRKAGIGVNLHYIPVHLHPYYRNLGFGEGDFPKSEKYYREAITIPLHYGLSEDDQDYIVDKLNKVLQ